MLKEREHKVIHPRLAGSGARRASNPCMTTWWRRCCPAPAFASPSRRPSSISSATRCLRCWRISGVGDRWTLVTYLDLDRRFAGDRFDPVRLDPDDVAFLTYTSGTTGPPKGAMNTHRNVVFNAQSDSNKTGLTPADVVLGVAPLFHITGTESRTWPWLCWCRCLSCSATASTRGRHWDLAPRQPPATLTIKSITRPSSR